jgi:hypothetical protein
MFDENVSNAPILREKNTDGHMAMMIQKSILLEEYAT